MTEPMPDRSDADVTLADLAASLDMTSEPEKVARYVGAFTEPDARTGRIAKPWHGKGMAATFTRAEADQIMAEWDRDAMSADRLVFLNPGDAEAVEVAERHHP